MRARGRALEKRPCLYLHAWGGRPANATSLPPPSLHSRPQRVYQVASLVYRPSASWTSSPASWAAWHLLPASVPCGEASDTDEQNSDRVEREPPGSHTWMPAPGTPVAPVGLLQVVIVGDVNLINLPGALVVGQVLPLDQVMYIPLLVKAATQEARDGRGSRIGPRQGLHKMSIN